MNGRRSRMYLEIRKKDSSKEKNRLLRYQQAVKKKWEGGRKNCQ